MKRHRWTTDENALASSESRYAKSKATTGLCLDCGMTRMLVQGRAQRGCYGYYNFMRLIYRYANGREAWSPNLGNRVPSPCRPPRETQ